MLPNCQIVLKLKSTELIDDIRAMENAEISFAAAGNRTELPIAFPSELDRVPQWIESRFGQIGFEIYGVLVRVPERIGTRTYRVPVRTYQYVVRHPLDEFCDPGCDLPRFNATEFLKRMKGKKIMFIGDSISSNQGTSLLCLLHAATGGSNITSTNASPISSVTFQDYDVTISVFLSHYLVDIGLVEIENRGNVTVLNLTSLSNGDLWKEQDVLIFNTWIWWGRKTWDIIDDNGKLLSDMNRTDAFRKALTTWANWVNKDVNPGKNKVFFQGISPNHNNGAEWNEPGTNCANKTTPLSGSTYPAGEPFALTVVKEVLSNISSSKHVELLNITTLSQLRKDGHPSAYGGLGGMDCTHWCVTGVMEAWNELLYARLFQDTLSIDINLGL